MKHEQDQISEVACLNSAGVTLLMDADETDPLVKSLKTVDRLQIDKNISDLDSVVLRLADLEDRTRVMDAQIHALVEALAAVTTSMTVLIQQQKHLMALL